MARILTLDLGQMNLYYRANIKLLEHINTRATRHYIKPIRQEKEIEKNHL
jgi:hypothetical protein